MRAIIIAKLHDHDNITHRTVIAYLFEIEPSGWIVFQPTTKSESGRTATTIQWRSALTEALSQALREQSGVLTITTRDVQNSADAIQRVMQEGLANWSPPGASVTKQPQQDTTPDSAGSVGRSTPSATQPGPRMDIVTADDCVPMTLEAGADIVSGAAAAADTMWRLHRLGLVPNLRELFCARRCRVDLRVAGITRVTVTDIGAIIAPTSPVLGPTVTDFLTVVRIRLQHLLDAEDARSISAR